MEHGWSDDGVSDARSPEDRPQLAQETSDGQFQRRDKKQQAHGERRLRLPAHQRQHDGRDERDEGQPPRDEPEVSNALRSHYLTHVSALAREAPVGGVAVGDLAGELPAGDDEDDVIAEPDDAERREDRHDDIPLLVAGRVRGDRCVEGGVDADDADDRQPMHDPRAAQKRSPPLEHRQLGKVQIEDRGERHPPGEAHQRVRIDVRVHELREVHQARDERQTQQVEDGDERLQSDGDEREGERDDKKTDGHEVATLRVAGDDHSQHLGVIEAVHGDGPRRHSRQPLGDVPDQLDPDADHQQDVHCTFGRLSLELRPAGERDDTDDTSQPQPHQTAADGRHREVVDARERRREHEQPEQDEDQHDGVQREHESDVQTEPERHDDNHIWKRADEWNDRRPKQLP